MYETQHTLRSTLNKGNAAKEKQNDQVGVAIHIHTHLDTYLGRYVYHLPMMPWEREKTNNGPRDISQCAYTTQKRRFHDNSFPSFII